MKRKARLAAGIGADCTLCSRPSSKQQLGPQHNVGSRYKNATQSPGHALRGLGPQQTPEQRARGSVSLPEPRLRGHLRPTRYGWVHVPDFFKRLPATAAKRKARPRSRTFAGVRDRALCPPAATRWHAASRALTSMNAAEERASPRSTRAQPRPVLLVMQGTHRSVQVAESQRRSLFRIRFSGSHCHRVFARCNRTRDAQVTRGALSASVRDSHASPIQTCRALREHG